MRATNLRHAQCYLTQLPQLEVICEPGERGKLRSRLPAGRWLRRIIVHRGALNYTVESVEINGTDLLASSVPAAIFAADSVIGMLDALAFSGDAKLVLRVINTSDATVTFAYTPYVQRG